MSKYQKEGGAEELVVSLLKKFDAFRDEMRENFRLVNQRLDSIEEQIGGRGAKESKGSLLKPSHVEVVEEVVVQAHPPARNRRAEYLSPKEETLTEEDLRGTKNQEREVVRERFVEGLSSGRSTRGSREAGTRNRGTSRRRRRISALKGRRETERCMARRVGSV